MFGLQINSFKFKNFFVQHIGKDTFLKPIILLIQSVSFKLNYWQFYKFKKFQTKSSITEIHIEFVSYCNLRCKLCSLDHEKTKIRLSAEILKRFFENFLNDNYFRSVRTIHLYNAGEVLLHPKLQEMLDVIKQFKERAVLNKRSFPQIALLTNATILDEKKSKLLIDSNVIDNIRFSMDGGNKEKFEEMRERADWNTFVKNIKNFCELNKNSKKPMQTGVITLVEYKNKLNTKWMSSEFKDLLNKVDGYELRYAHNWTGDFEIEKSKHKLNFKIGCSLLMHQLVLLPNGDITVCCADLNSNGVIGNITKESLFEIYNKPQRMEMLQKFIENKKEEIDLCKNCETF